jgi:hypothetical protein
MSQFIENSKDPAMSGAVAEHFGTASSGTKPGVASGKGYGVGGTAAWNSQSADTGAIERSNINSGPYGAPPGASQFNAPGQSLPRETGVNYKPLKNAGHRVTQDPFEMADGFPGNK